MNRPWRVKMQDPEQVSQLARSHNLDELLVKCILNREVLKFQEMDYFLAPARYQPPDPFLMPDMKIAADRVLDAIQKGERICIYGDYDADGVTAIAILTQAIRELGGNVFYFIPDRFFEGVGLHAASLKQLQEEEEVGLVITVDTGIRAFEEIDFAKEIKLDVIITDHHPPGGGRPNAFAVVNPKMEGSRYPFDGLCGAGVAFKLVQALGQVSSRPLNLNKYMQIAAIGTIADMVPLREENRWIVAQGLKAISQDESGPIRSLLRKLGIRGAANALDISFKVAPRINAPGRLGDPDTAISFFDCTLQSDTYRIIETMEGMNTLRQKLERELEEKLELQLRHAFRQKIPPFVMVAGRHWHRGILGILACKMLRRFSRPACVLSFDAENAHGSIRGLPGLNLLEALQEISPLLSSFGGHPEAAGISLPITNVPQFKLRMTEILGPRVSKNHQEVPFEVDAVIRWRDLNSNLCEKLWQLAPFGIGNSVPVFLSPNLILESELSRKGPWYHFEVSDGCVSRKCSFYHPIDLDPGFERFDSVDLIYSLTPFRDNYQVQIVEMRPSKG